MLARIFSERRQSGSTDLEAVEMALRASLHTAGAKALTQLLQFAPPPETARQVPCACGQQAVYVELRSKTVLTVVGKAQVQRPYYLCPNCGHGQFPVDVDLDLGATEFSPGVRRMLAVVGHTVAFDHGRQQIEALAGLQVTTKAVERIAEAIGEDIAQRQEKALALPTQMPLPIRRRPAIPFLYVEMDGTGIPVVRAETKGRAGKQEGQPAHTREAKLGCVFTQTTVDENGRPVRDEASTTYIAKIESAEEFGRRLYAEALRRGWDEALNKSVLGDGAVWVWNQAELHFFDAVHIVDLWHASEHLWHVARSLHPTDLVQQRRWIMPQQHKLENGKIESLVKIFDLLARDYPASAKLLADESQYFQRNAQRMRYPEFRKMGFFVGSGVVEAGCKSMGSRLKQSGMFWTVRGANAMLALRCCMLSGNFEDYWEARRA